MELPPELAEGGDPPGASYFAKLRAFLRSMRLSVAPGCGLTLTPGHGGTVLGFNRGPLPRIAIATGSITAYNATTKTLGQGQAMPQRIKLTSAGAVLVPVGGASITLYNLDVGSPSGTAITSGRVLQYKIVDDLPLIDWDAC